MDRSLAGRLGIGSLLPQPARAGRGAATAKRRKRRGAPPRRQPNVFDWALARLAALLAAAARLVRGGSSFAWRRRRLRIALVVLAIASPLLAGGWLWLRNSSLVVISHVRVTGAHGSDAHAIAAALSSAAHGMTTLDVNRQALHAAVASYPVVSGLKISTSFPHGMSVRVVEQPAVAALTVAGTKTAVAANGVALGPGLASGSLPVLSGATLPAPGQRLHDVALLGALSALGAAPASLARQVSRAHNASKGLTFVMRGGLLAYFGDATRAHAKWLSLSRVLADPSSVGAAYVDVRVPERPAAGFPGGVAPPTGTESEASAGESSAGESGESLAEGLSAAVGAGTSATAPQTGEASSTSESESERESQSSASSTGESSGETEPQTKE